MAFDKFKEFFDQSPVAMVEGSWEKTFEIISCNPAAIELFRAKDAKSLKEACPKILKKLPKKSLFELLGARVSGKPFEGDFYLPTLQKGVRIYVLMRLVYIKGGKDSSRVLVTFQDILRFKRNETDLKKLVQLDGLTKIFNQRAICERLDEELSRAKRYKLNLSCVIFDLDNFKGVNDTFGHLEGNKCIKQVASLLKQSLRKTDIVGRYGGDEFLVILPETPKHQAVIPVERFLKIYEPHATFRQKGKSIVTSFSIGISGFPEEGVATGKELIAAADKALYLSKKSGGNQVNMAVPKNNKQ